MGRAHDKFRPKPYDIPSELWKFKDRWICWYRSDRGYPDGCVYEELYEISGSWTNLPRGYEIVGRWGRGTTGLPPLAAGSEVTVSLKAGTLTFSHNGEEVHRYTLPEGGPIQLSVPMWGDGKVTLL